MKTRESRADRSALLTEDDLFRIEIKVARRADQLSEQGGRDRNEDRAHWLQAEREIFSGCDESRG